MKNVKFNSILSVIFSLITFVSFTQNPFYIERDIKDSTRFRFCVQERNAMGAYTINCTQNMSSDSVVSHVLTLADQRKKTIEAAPWQTEFNNLDTLLKRATGRVYNDFVKEAMSLQLVGNWSIKHSDSIEVDITIDKSLKIKGGTIKGSVTINKDNSFTISNVLAEPITLKADNGVLTGTYRKKPVSMTKSQ